MNILQEIQNLKSMFKGHPLLQDHPLRPWSRFIRFQVSSLLSSSPRTYDWIDPLKLVVPRKSGLTAQLYCGLMDFEEMMFMLHFLRKDDVLADVGANVGVYSLLASGLTGARSLAFEPVPSTFARLQEHVRLNQVEDRVQCINQGVGEKAGSLRFSCNQQDCLNHVLNADDEDEEFIEVPVTTLNELSKTESPAMLKLDIEGYEWYALQGAGEMLQSGYPKAVVMEYNSQADRYHIAPEQIEQLLCDAGYRSYRYDPFDRSLTETPFNTNGNSLWIRDTDQIKPRLQKARSYTVFGQVI